MSLYNRLPRKLALFIEGAIPALLVLSVVGIGYVKTSDNAAASRQAKRSNQALSDFTKRSDAALAKLAHDDAISACDTVHSSDVALHDFLAKSIGSGQRSQDPTVQKFLDDLAFAQNVTYGQCLTKVQKQPGPPAPSASLKG